MVSTRPAVPPTVATSMLVAVLLGTLLSSAPCAAAPPEPGSSELVSAPSTWDGRTVVFTGEAIDEAMVRGDHAWLHLNDDAYARRGVAEGAPLSGYNSGLAVWVGAEQVDKIGLYGRHRTRGDLVSVRGTFNAACAEHGGDMDLHATSLVVVEPGVVAGQRVTPWKVVLAVALAALVVALWGARMSLVARARRGLGGIA